MFGLAYYGKAYFGGVYFGPVEIPSTGGLPASATLQATGTGGLRAAAVLIVAPTPAVNTLPTTGLYSLIDFGKRLIAVLPIPWFPSSSLIAGAQPANANEIPVGSIMQGVGSGFAQTFSELTYTQLQTRLATGTDINLDQASIDFFGGVLPRIVGETDTFFSARIRQLVAINQPSGPGMQAVLSAYMRSLLLSQRGLASYAADIVGAMDTQGAMDVVLPSGITAPIQAYGMDTSGAMDTYGFLDEQSQQNYVNPVIYVFDNQSDPVTSAIISLKPPQFGVALLFPGAGINLLHVDPTPFVPITTLTPVGAPLSMDVAGSMDNFGGMDESIPMGSINTPGPSVYFNQQFVGLVYWMKAEGTTPVFCTTGAF